MKKVFKRICVLMFMVIAFTTTTNVSASVVGKVLLMPEDGWARYEQEDPLIIYTGSGWFQNSGYDQLTEDKNAKIKVCFKGTGIRILGFTYTTRSDQKISIDNTISNTYISSQGWQTNRVIYEKLDMSDGIHYVEIENVGNNTFFSIDAIDIQGGEIIPYVEPTTTSSALSILLEVDEIVQLSVSNNLGLNSSLQWTSSDDTVANVDESGKVTALKEGDTAIKAKSVDGSYEEEILIKVLGEAEELRLAMHLKLNESKRLYLNDDFNNINWKSMDENIATVDNIGKVTGVSTGLALVTAEYDTETYVCYVRVA